MTITSSRRIVHRNASSCALPDLRRDNRQPRAAPRRRPEIRANELPRARAALGHRRRNHHAPRMRPAASRPGRHRPEPRGRLPTRVVVSQPVLGRRTLIHPKHNHRPRSKDRRALDPTRAATGDQSRPTTLRANCTTDEQRTARPTSPKDGFLPTPAAGLRGRIVDDRISSSRLAHPLRTPGEGFPEARPPSNQVLPCIAARTCSSPRAVPQQECGGRPFAERSALAGGWS